MGRVKVHKVSKKGLVKNVAKVTEDGITFDSRLEHFFWKTCKQLGIAVKVKPEKFTVLEKFKFHAESIRPITYTPDFYLPEYHTIIETKGYANDAFPLRLKLLKKYLVDSGRTEKYKQIKTQKEAKEYLLGLLK